MANYRARKIVENQLDISRDKVIDKSGTMLSSS